jgi:asparagine synthase (glutamine-hydrolysing)
MCGIAGIICHSGQDEQSARVRRMVDALRHRGPDGFGVLKIGSKATLGHARLSIVDLEAGTQPMKSRDGRLAITFNGEIYGYRELRKQFDYPYSTESDTEVILAMFQKSGEEMIRCLPGMFSFAIWDDHAHTLFCARDRFGEKPFFYALSPEGDFIFASEIKAILESGLIEPVLDLESVAHFLRKSYVHPHKTIYSNIFTLPPAHSLTFRHGRVIVQKYWEFPRTSSQISLEDAAARLGELLRKAVKKQLVADVPVSGFLSSGLDSTTIMALAAEENSSLTAFSFDFQNTNSEADIAEHSAKRYGLKFQRLEIGNFEPAEILQKTISIYDEPFADSSSIPTYLISKAAAGFTKVALTGDGGDELLGGYDYFYKPLLRFDDAKRWGGNRRLVYLVAKILWKLRMKQSGLGLFDLGDKMPALQGHQDIWQALSERRSVFSFEELQEQMEPIGSGFVRHPAPNFATNRRMEDVFLYDIETYMAGQILVKTDRASMANGLELRAPFLDAEFAEFALALPSSLKLSSSQSKIVLRKAFDSLWNSEVANNYKRGFDSPIQDWLKTPRFAQLIEDFLHNSDRKIHGLVNFGAKKDWSRFNPQQVYNFLVLSMWLESNSFSRPPISA